MQKVYKINKNASIHVVRPSSTNNSKTKEKTITTDIISDKSPY